MKFSILHSLAATGPVAVVEVDALALKNEGADTVLRSCQCVSCRDCHVMFTCGFATVRSAWRGMMSGCIWWYAMRLHVS